MRKYYSKVNWSPILRRLRSVRMQSSSTDFRATRCSSTRTSRYEYLYISLPIAMIKNSLKESGCPQQGKTGRNREKHGVLFQTGKTQGILRFRLNTGKIQGILFCQSKIQGKYREFCTANYLLYCNV